jgi:hypothetical protein
MSPELQVELTAEAKAFGKYLLGEQVNARAVTLYLAAHDQTQFESDAQDRRLLTFMLQHPSLIGVIDAGLAIRKDKSYVRKKLYYMLAILEAMPEYAKYFLFDGSPLTNALRLFFFGVRGVMRMIVGYLLCGVL